ncbi:MAG: glycosyltransferase [Armatimonadetes bacterium]|nr:glycosyltransferase [Armatimonadota bacterium]
MPRVSVIVPNYNHARYLNQRIESVLNQTFRDIEVIILDDASTDNSRDIIARWETDSRVRVIVNEVNSGSVFKQWNKGMREASGEFLWIAESDDFADPAFLEILVPRLESNPAAGVAYCQSWVVDENGRRQFILEERREYVDADRWKSDFSNDGRDECARYFILGSMIANVSSALIRRCIAEDVGYADEDWTIAGDYAFWVKLLLASDIEFVAKPLNYWRVHSNTVRNVATRNGLMVKEAYQVATHISRNVAVPKDILEKARALRFYSWVCYNEEHWFGIKQNRVIYEVARLFDPAIRRRILRYLPLFPIRVIGRPLKKALLALGPRSRGGID